MRDYEKLLERLREEAREADTFKLMEDLFEAANAIEELCREKKRLDDKAIELQAIADHYEAASQEWFQTACEYKDATPKWISVDERLPEDRHDVLVYAGVLFPYITVGYYDGIWKFSYSDVEIAGGANYWMPLPEPPKEVTDG